MMSEIVTSTNHQIQLNQLKKVKREGCHQVKEEPCFNVVYCYILRVCDNFSFMVDKCCPEVQQNV